MDKRLTKSVGIFKFLFLCCVFIVAPLGARAYQNPDYFDTNYPNSYDRNNYYSNTYPLHSQTLHNQADIEPSNIDYYTSNYILPSNMGYYSGASSPHDDISYCNDVYFATTVNAYHREVEENLNDYREKIQETTERIKSYQNDLKSLEQTETVP
ncbi:MAG: hypothetical protein JSW17_03035 [Candidatus Omnitrophota bacterium]|nr:MAG: hypothetical protein JSW17_03035 [Candidatus Omnitrophota bacterium]